MQTSTPKATHSICSVPLYSIRPQLIIRKVLDCRQLEEWFLRDHDNFFGQHPWHCWEDKFKSMQDRIMWRVRQMRDMEAGLYLWEVHDGLK
jgi:hypothetical protein